MANNLTVNGLRAKWSGKDLWKSDGGVQLFASIAMNGVNGNYDGLAYNIGSIVGGFSVGGFMSGAIRYSITGETRGGYSLAQDAANRYDSNYMNPDGVARLVLPGAGQGT
jgi:hypothetical protein